MIGCEIHRFNLAVRDISYQHDNIVYKVDSFMVKLKSLLLAAKLRKLTGRTERTMKQTRWSSRFVMLVRYRQIKDCILLLHAPQVEALSLSTSEDRKLALQQTHRPKFVTNLLQRDETTMQDVRSLFNIFMDEFADTLEGLKEAVDIFHSPIFYLQLLKQNQTNQAV